MSHFAHLSQIVTKANQVGLKRPVSKITERSASFFPGSLGKEQHYPIVSAVGILGAFIAVTAAVAVSPLDEFEKIDKNNICYHRHLHPR